MPILSTNKIVHGRYMHLWNGKFTMPVDLKNIVFIILIVNVYWSEGITIVGKE